MAIERNTSHKSESEHIVRQSCGCGRPFDISMLSPGYRKQRQPDNLPAGTRFYCWTCYDRVKPKDWRDAMVDERVKK